MLFYEKTAPRPLTTKIDEIQNQTWNELNYWVLIKRLCQKFSRLKTEMNPSFNKDGLESDFSICSSAQEHSNIYFIAEHRTGAAKVEIWFLYVLNAWHCGAEERVGSVSIT